MNSEVGIKFLYRLQDFVRGKVFPWAVALLTYVFWVSGAGFYGIFVMLLISAALFAFLRETSPVLVVSALFLFALSDAEFPLYAIIMLSAGAAAAVAGIVVHLVRFKPSFSFLKPDKIKGYTFAVLLILPAVALGGVTVSGRNTALCFLIIAGAAAVSLAYIFLYATIENADGKLFETVMRAFAAVGALLCLQMLTIALKCGSLEALKSAIDSRAFCLSWLHPNNTAIVLAFCVPVTMYFATKLKKLAFLPILLAAVEFSVMLLTLSRGAVLISLISLPFAAVLTAIKAPNRKTVLITYAVLLAAVAVACVFFKDTLSALLSRVTALGLSDNGRFDIYRFAMSVFEQYPIFGAGLDYGFGFWGTYQFFWFHSTVFQILACFGVFGTVCFAYFFFARYRAFVIKPDTTKLFALIGLLVLELYGLIDIVFFLPYTYIVMMILCLCAEKSLPEDRGLAFVFKKTKTKKSDMPV